MKVCDGQWLGAGFVLWGFRWQFRSRGAALLLFGVVFLFISSIFLSLMAGASYKAHRLAGEGQLAAGTVIKKLLHPAGDNGTPNTWYEAAYTFTTRDGRKVETDATIDADHWDQIHEGGPVQVEYAASNPELNQIGKPQDGLVFIDSALVVAAAMWLVGATLAFKGLRGIWFASTHGGTEPTVAPVHNAGVRPWIAAATALFGSGAIFLLIGVVNLHQDRLFQSEGRTASAIVLTKSTHLQYDSKSKRQQNGYYLGYRFTTHDGSSVEGSDSVSLQQWNSIRERDSIEIVYLPESPTRNRLASDQPAIWLWMFSILGAALIVGGLIAVGYGFRGSLRKKRRRRSA